MDFKKFRNRIETRPLMISEQSYNEFWIWKISVEAKNGAHILDNNHLGDACNKLLAVLPKWKTYRGANCDYRSVLPASLSNIAEAYDKIRRYSLLEFNNVPDEALRYIWDELGRVKEPGGKPRKDGDYCIISVCKPLMFLWGQTPPFDSVNRREMHDVSVGPVLPIPRVERWKYLQWKNALLDLQRELVGNNKVIDYCERKALQVYGSKRVILYGRYLDIYYFQDEKTTVNKGRKSSLSPARCAGRREEHQL